MIRAHIYISGRVQGVFFRHNTKSVALKLGTKGWVRNLVDGRVEAVFEGDDKNVAELIEWCKKGPLGASVDAIETSYEPHRGEFKTFEIVYY